MPEKLGLGLTGLMGPGILNNLFVDSSYCLIKNKSQQNDFRPYLMQKLTMCITNQGA